MRGANDEIFMALILSLKCTFCHRETSFEASGKDWLKPQVEHNLHGVSIGALG